MAVLPGRSWSVFLGPVTEEGGATYGLLGPFPEGVVVRRFRFFWWNDSGAQACSFGVSVGGSGQADFGAWSEGMNILSRSTWQDFKQTFVRFYAGAQDHGWFELPWGGFVNSGSRYAVVRVTGASSPGQLNVLVTVDVLDRVKD